MARAGIKQSTKAHKSYMELENIIEDMGNAMRRAHLSYVADSERLTPRMEMIWSRYVVYAAKQTHV